MLLTQAPENLERKKSPSVNRAKAVLVFGVDQDALYLLALLSL